MDFMSRLLNGFLLFTALAVSFVNLSAERLGEWWAPKDHFGDRHSLTAVRQKGEQLERERRAIRERNHSTEKIVEEMINGEMSLFEAAALFRSLHETPQLWRDPLRPCPRHDEGERWCHLVIDYADNKVRIEQSPRQADDLRHRLEAALQEQRDHHGGVKLPG